MRLWLDCEWDGYQGALLSVALVAENGAEFYEVLAVPEITSDWVRENVVPKLNRDPICFDTFQYALEVFLAQFETVHVIADWPEDIERFCRCLIRGPGQRIQFPCLTMEIVHIDAVSTLPHNALHDARAIKRDYLLGER